MIFKVLEVVEDKKDLIQREQYYLDILKPEFNMCSIAGSQLGIKRSKEFKEKVSQRNKGRVLSEETKRKKSEAMKLYWSENKDKYEILRSINKNKTYKHKEESIEKMKLNNTRRLSDIIISKIIILKAEGFKNKDIADKLGISTYSVRKYLKLSTNEL